MPRATKKNGRRKPKRRFAKSSITREAAINGAIKCFLELGYSRSSTIEIAKMAKISRGAMIYHFPTKKDLLSAALVHINTQRIQQFADAIRLETKRPDREIDMTGVDVYWKYVNSPMSIAYMELLMASRTDKQLARLIRSSTKKFEQSFREIVQEVFPEWANKGELLDLALALVQFMLEGMALNRYVHAEGSTREKLRDYLKKNLADIYEDATDPKSKSPER